MTLILGTDHSHYDWETQDGLYVPIDYDAAFQNGSRFTFLKVCNGAVVQSHALDELKRAMASPLLAAPYSWVFPIDYITAEVQARTEFNAVGHLKCPIAKDLEETIPYAPRDPNGDDLKACIQAYWRLDPSKRFAIYSRWDYWRTHVNINDPFWKDERLSYWWATGDREPPEIPWDFWQDGGSREPTKWGVKNGKQFVDTNWTNWTMEKLAAWFGEDVPVEPEPPIEENPMSISIGTVVTAGLNVRSTPDSSVTTNIIGASFLKAGDLVQYDRVSGFWAHLKAARRAGVDLVLPGPECWAAIGETNGFIRPEWMIDAVPVPMPDAEVTLELSSATVDGEIYVPDHLDAAKVVFKKAA
jgi:hypothetical protein